MAAGYYRFPTIHEDTLVFSCEDDLWTVAAGGGVARRLTANLGQASHPALSPDGALLAFTGRDEGDPEVYLMPAAGGPAQRLTYLGASTQVVGWSRDGQDILFACNAMQPFARQFALHAVNRAGGDPVPLPTGPAMSISYGPDGGAVIARFATDLARWKRYRGGLTGDFWIDRDGNGDWQRLIKLKGNLALPLWVGARIYFVSDHEGIGNLYSCLPTGEDVRRHTHHDDYYVRHPATDGRRIVYHAGADLYLFDPATNSTQLIAVEFHSPQVQRKRKFVPADHYVQGANLHPAGHALAITARGQVFTMSNWEGPVVQHGEAGSVRYRLAVWLHDGKRLALVSDARGEEGLEIHHADASSAPERLEGLDLGRPNRLIASPKQAQIALSNHRNELILVDLEAKTARVLDRSAYERIHGMDWSPDGRWLAYALNDSQQTALIKLCRVEDGATWAATKPVLIDTAPAFDPDGKYLYFISYRDFDPVYDELHFDLNFPRGARPYLLTLQADLSSPFIPVPPEQKEPNEQKDEPKHAEKNGSEAPAQESSTPAQAAEQALRIDLDGITERIVAFPVPVGRYAQVRGIKGKALFSSYPIEGSLNQNWFVESGPPSKGTLELYDFEEQSCETLIDGISGFALSPDAKTLVYRAGWRLRVLKAGEKPKENGGTTRKSGWIDLDRIKLSVTPPDEWAQMYREAWRLQRDQFWTEDMSGVDWQEVYRRYQPLLGRVGTRAEFSDLLWEMQGELGTSHAYEIGGDYRHAPHYHQGFLGADLRYDAESDSYRITHIVQGDVWDEQSSSPLARPGVNVRPGDRLIALNGRKLSRATPPQALLVNQAESEVLLTVVGADNTPRTLSVKTLRNETAARYRQWVETNRRRVHAATAGRVGYVHIPDMGAHGYAEFHRGFLAELAREGLVVDVRFNGGGHVSELLLEKLARRRIGYGVPRWGQPSPYPVHSPAGPIVALTNEQAGSDGDVFSHAFKLLKLGPLIGKRTWGGVIGIHVRDRLVDGSVTTQPEYSFWFEDVGWGVENYGTDPTIEVDIRPQDYVAGDDPQLERAISEVLQLLAAAPPPPDFQQRPRLHLPTLPK